MSDQKPIAVDSQAPTGTGPHTESLQQQEPPINDESVTNYENAQAQLDDLFGGDENIQTESHAVFDNFSDNTPDFGDLIAQEPEQLESKEEVRGVEVRPESVGSAVADIVPPEKENEHHAINSNPVAYKDEINTNITAQAYHESADSKLQKDFKADAQLQESQQKSVTEPEPVVKSESLDAQDKTDSISAQVSNLDIPSIGKHVPNTHVQTTVSEEELSQLPSQEEEQKINAVLEGISDLRVDDHNGPENPSIPPSTAVDLNSLEEPSTVPEPSEEIDDIFASHNDDVVVGDDVDVDVDIDEAKKLNDIVCSQDEKVHDFPTSFGAETEPPIVEKIPAPVNDDDVTQEQGQKDAKELDQPVPQLELKKPNNTNLDVQTNTESEIKEKPAPRKLDDIFGDEDDEDENFINNEQELEKEKKDISDVVDPDPAQKAKVDNLFSDEVDFGSIIRQPDENQDEQYKPDTNQTENKFGFLESDSDEDFLEDELAQQQQQQTQQQKGEQQRSQYTPATQQAQNKYAPNAQNYSTNSYNANSLSSNPAVQPYAPPSAPLAPAAAPPSNLDKKKSKFFEELPITVAGARPRQSKAELKRQRQALQAQKVQSVATNAAQFGAPPLNAPHGSVSQKQQMVPPPYQNAPFQPGPGIPNSSYGNQQQQQNLQQSSAPAPVSRLPYQPHQEPISLTGNNVALSNGNFGSPLKKTQRYGPSSTSSKYAPPFAPSANLPPPTSGYNHITANQRLAQGSPSFANNTLNKGYTTLPLIPGATAPNKYSPRNAPAAINAPPQAGPAVPPKSKYALPAFFENNTQNAPANNFQNAPVNGFQQPSAANFQQPSAGNFQQAPLNTDGQQFGANFYSPQQGLQNQQPQTALHVPIQGQPLIPNSTSSAAPPIVPGPPQQAPQTSASSFPGRSSSITLQNFPAQKKAPFPSKPTKARKASFKQNADPFGFPGVASSPEASKFSNSPYAPKVRNSAASSIAGSPQVTHGFVSSANINASANANAAPIAAGSIAPVINSYGTTANVTQRQPIEYYYGLQMPIIKFSNNGEVLIVKSASAGNDTIPVGSQAQVETKTVKDILKIEDKVDTYPVDKKKGLLEKWIQEKIDCAYGHENSVLILKIFRDIIDSNYDDVTFYKSISRTIFEHFGFVVGSLGGATAIGNNYKVFKTHNVTVDAPYLSHLSKSIIDNNTIDVASSNNDWALSLLVAGLFNKERFLSVSSDFITSTFKNDQNKDSFLLYLFFKSFVSTPDLLATLTVKEKSLLEENWFSLLAYILNSANEANLPLIKTILVQYGKYFQDFSHSGNKAQINFILASLPVEAVKFDSNNILYYIFLDIYAYILDKKNVAHNFDSKLIKESLDAYLADYGYKKITAAKTVTGWFGTKSKIDLSYQFNKFIAGEENAKESRQESIFDKVAANLTSPSNNTRFANSIVTNGHQHNNNALSPIRSPFTPISSTRNLRNALMTSGPIPSKALQHEKGALHESVVPDNSQSGVADASNLHGGQSMFVPGNGDFNAVEANHAISRTQSSPAIAPMKGGLSKYAPSGTTNGQANFEPPVNGNAGPGPISFNHNNNSVTSLSSLGNQALHITPLAGNLKSRTRKFSRYAPAQSSLTQSVQNSLGVTPNGANIDSAIASPYDVTGPESVIHENYSGQNITEPYAAAAQDAHAPDADNLDVKKSGANTVSVSDFGNSANALNLGNQGSVAASPESQTVMENAAESVLDNNVQASADAPSPLPPQLKPTPSANISGPPPSIGLNKTKRRGAKKSARYAPAGLTATAAFDLLNNSEASENSLKVDLPAQNASGPLVPSKPFVATQETSLVEPVSKEKSATNRNQGILNDKVEDLSTAAFDIPYVPDVPDVPAANVDDESVFLTREIESVSGPDKIYGVNAGEIASNELYAAKEPSEDQNLLPQEPPVVPQPPPKLESSNVYEPRQNVATKTSSRYAPPAGASVSTPQLQPADYGDVDIYNIGKPEASPEPKPVNDSIMNTPSSIPLLQKHQEVPRIQRSNLQQNSQALDSTRISRSSSIKSNRYTPADRSASFANVSEVSQDNAFEPLEATATTNFSAFEPVTHQDIEESLKRQYEKQPEYANSVYSASDYNAPSRHSHARGGQGPRNAGYSRFAPLDEPPSFANRFRRSAPSVSSVGTASYIATYIQDDTIYEDEDEYDISEDEEEVEMEKSIRQKTQKKKPVEKPKRKVEEKRANGGKSVSRKSSGWLNWLGKKEDDKGPRVYKAKLGEESNFYYDEKLKRWINKNQPLEEQMPKAAPPPPKMKKQPSTSPAAGPPSGLAAGPTAGPKLTPSAPSVAFSQPPLQSTVSSPSATKPGDGPVKSTPIPSLGYPKKPGVKKAASGNELEDILGLAGGPGTMTRRKAKKGSRRGYVNVMETMQAQNQ